MKAYLITTGTVFAVLVVLHVWRLVVEGGHLLADPFFWLITLVAAGLSVWAWSLVRLSSPKR
ncbi:MAG TPA: hypothetical protein VIW26_00170 [Gemmatimonadales bacterium]|jgi:hypothetical protein